MHNCRINSCHLTFSYTDTLHKHTVTALSDGSMYQYDRNGNMTRRLEAGISYTQTWDIDNHLTNVAKGTSSTQYYYDADGALVRKVEPRGQTVYASGDYEVFYPAVVTVTIPSTFTHKLYMPFVSIAQTNGPCHDTCTYYRFNGQQVAVRTGGTVYWLHGDHLGSASATTDIFGTKVSELRYKPYGEIRYSSGNTPTDKRFTSQEQQADIGLYSFGARFFDPQIGRFVSADTLVPGATNPQALNRYSYGVNNPLKYTDPSGHCFGWAGGADTAVCTGLLFAGPPGWVVDAALIVVGVVVVAGVGVIVANQIDQANKAATPDQVNQQSQPPAVSPSGQVGSPTGPGGFDPFGNWQWGPNYRKNYEDYWNVKTKEGYQVHHILRRQFVDILEKDGINVNDPRFLREVRSAAGSENDHAQYYTNRWNEMIRQWSKSGHLPTSTDIVRFAQQLEKELYDKFGEAFYREGPGLPGKVQSSEWDWLWEQINKAAHQ